MWDELGEGVNWVNEVIGVNGGDLSVWGELGESGEYDELSECDELGE